MNRFIQFEYTDKDFAVIDDYKNQPDSSLDSALKPVSSYVDQLDHYIKKAKQFRHFPSEHDLTKDESAAIYLYMDDWGDQSLHRVLNQILQSYDRKKVTLWLGFLKIFDTALEKLPNVKDTIWRGLPIDIAEKLKENEEVILCSVTSCSLSADVIKSCLSSSSVLCYIDPLYGKDVCRYTPHPNDQEVLLRPGTRLRVKSKGLNNREHKFDISFEEISEIIDANVPSDADAPMLSANEEGTKNVDDPETNSTKVSKEMSNVSVPKNEGPKGNLIKALITFSNGDRYKLTYLNGKKHGYGKYYSIDGKKLKEQEADDMANGEGICAFEDATRFVGTFERGTQQGHGILFNLDGSIQAGAWFNDEPNGECLKINANRGHYDWKDAEGETHWYGAYDDGKGNKYIGNVVDGKAHGLGLRIWNDSSRYEGNFKNDKKHGFGTYNYASGGKYTGNWANDEMSGHGSLEYPSTTRYKGAFKNGKRHGLGKLTFSTGQIKDGLWENDKFNG